MKRKKLAIVFFICTFGIGLGIGLGIGAVAVANVLSDIVEEYKKSADKNTRLFQLMSQWVRLKQQGKNIVSYFEKNNYENIAIYGKGVLGESLAKEMLNSNITVKYFIDQKADKSLDRCTVSPDSGLDPVDMIVITPVLSYEEIKQKLVKKVNCPVISIEDILFEI